VSWGNYFVLVPKQAMPFFPAKYQIQKHLTIAIGNYYIFRRGLQVNVNYVNL